MSAVPASADSTTQGTSETVDSPRWSPYPGLRPFQSGDSEYFYGRDIEADEVVARLRQKRFVAVIGGSGSGKSSLVLAGAIPRLRTSAIKEAGDFWAPVVATPGTNHVEGDSPIRRLARKFCGELAESAEAPERLEACVTLLRCRNGLGKMVERYGGQLKNPEGVSLDRLQVNFLFLLDQFEELFHPSNAREPITADCQELVDRIVEQFKEPHPQVCVALTMRSEHLNDCPRYEMLPDAINAASYLVKRLGVAELRSAIEQPVLRYLRKHAAEQRDARRQARLAGKAVASATPGLEHISIDPELIDRLLDDSKAVLAQQDHADHLPLLQHVLFWIWHEASVRCADRTLVDALTLEDLWQAVGAMPGTKVVHSLEISVNTLEACLDNRCQAIFNRSASEQDLWEAAFRSLAFKDPNAGTYTQQRAPMADLCQVLGIAGADNDALKQRLLPWMQPHGYLHWDLDSRTVKVAHETLIRRWQQFRRWIDEEDRQFHVYLRLLEDCERWKEAEQNVRESKLSGGDTLRRYEDEQLPIILKDPVRVSRIHRLLGMDRDGQHLATLTDNAVRFLDLSIASRSRREQQREREEKKKREDAEKFAQAQRDNDVLHARAETEKQRNAALVSSNAALTARADAEAEKNRRIKFWRRGLVVGLIVFVLFSVSELMLARRERTLHRGYALAAETQVKLQPQFADFDAATLPLRHALQGTYFFQSGSAQYTGPAAIPPLSWLYSSRIKGLQSTEALGEVRNITSLRSVLRNSVWPVTLNNSAKLLTPVPPSNCDSVSFKGKNQTEAFKGARFYAGPQMADNRGLIVTARDVQGFALFVGRKNADNTTCVIENQLISAPGDVLRVGVAADLSNIVFEFNRYFQVYAIIWNYTHGAVTQARVAIDKLEKDSLGGDIFSVQQLPSAYSEFATDIKVANRTLRMFDIQPTPITEGEANKALQLKKDPKSLCARFAETQSVNKALDEVRSGSAPNDPRTYCLHVKRAQVSAGEQHNQSLYLASLYAFEDEVQASDSTKHLPLFLEEVVGTELPTEVTIEVHDAWLAFKNNRGEWIALPWGLSAWRSLANGVFVVPPIASLTWWGRMSSFANRIFPNSEKPAMQVDQPFTLLLSGEVVDDLNLRNDFPVAKLLPSKNGTLMGKEPPFAGQPLISVPLSR